LTRGTSCVVAGLFLFVPLALIVFGTLILVGSLLQTPGDRTASAAYRSDPSCSAPIDSPTVPTGACTIAAATIQTATGGTPSNASSRSGTARLPSFTLAMADGSQQEVSIRSDAFFRIAYPGDTVRVQLYDGAITRIGERGTSVETIANPGDKAAGDRVLPYIGGGMCAIGLALLAAGFSARKRQQ
jgi:hypothetical protein